MQTKLAMVLGIASALAGGSVFVARPPIIAALDQRTIDFVTRTVPPGAPDGSVVIVDINEASLVRRGHWPWPRPLMGQLVKSLTDEGAAAVVLDMMYPASAADPLRAAAEDEKLAEALAGRPTVVGYFLQFRRVDGSAQACPLPSFPLVVTSARDGQSQLFPKASGGLCNAPAISMAAAGAGFLNAAPDRDANFRLAPLLMEFNGRYQPSLGLAAVSVYRGGRAVELRQSSGGDLSLRLADRVIPLEGEGYLRLRFRGKRGTFPYVGAAEFLEGRAPAGRLRGAIAIVGSSAPGLEVTVSTPVDPLLPGVELQATVIDNLLRAEALSRPADAAGWELLSAIGIGVGAAFLSAVTGPIWAVAGAVVLIGCAWAGSVLLASVSGLVLSPLPVTATVFCNYSVFAATYYLRQKGRADQTV
ncbi:MAG: CHASE2 domain-containing protein, partial [Bryobacteraceae bacterium]